MSYFSASRPESDLPDITAEWNGAALTAAIRRDPAEAWTIWKDKMYLNMIPEVTITWRYNPDELIERADKKWKATNTK